MNWLDGENAIQILSKEKPVYSSNSVPSHFTSGGTIKTTEKAGAYLIEGVIGGSNTRLATQFQWSREKI